MKITTRWMCALLALAGPSLALAALKVPGPEHLPADTWVLVNWHGVANATRVRGTNPVMQLWDDPQFAAARELLVTKIISSAGKSIAPDAARAAIGDILSMLENPALVGVVGDPLAPGKGTVHGYAVLNRKGKEAEWARLHPADRLRANTQVSTYAFRDVQVTRTITTKTPKPAAAPDPGAPAGPPPQPKVSTSFSASLGDYELFADDQAVMEALITRLQDGSRSGDSLLKNAAYKRAQRFRAKGPLLEVFVKMPDLSQAHVPVTPQVNMPAALRELHLERAQGLWFSAGMQRKRMMVRAALIGDTKPGSVMDLLGGNVRDFQTLAAAPADASFGAFRIDLPAMYETFINAVKMGMPANQGVAVSAMLDSAVMAQTGMRITELLSLLNGEFAIVTSSDRNMESAALPAMVMIPAKGEQVLGLLRKFAGQQMSGAEQVAGATIVKIGPFPMPASATAAAGAKPGGNLLDPFYLAVSPDMLVISPDRPELEAVLKRAAAHEPAPEGSLAADKQFRATRKSFPRELNGISYTDYSRVRWDRYVQKLHEQMARQRQLMLDRADQAEKGDEKSPPNPQVAAQLRKSAEQIGSFDSIIAELLPLAGKHLKISAAGSWKARDGEFFDSYVN